MQNRVIFKFSNLRFKGKAQSKHVWVGLIDIRTYIKSLMALKTCRWNAGIFVRRCLFYPRECCRHSWFKKKKTTKQRTRGCELRDGEALKPKQRREFEVLSKWTVGNSPCCSIFLSLPPLSPSFPLLSKSLFILCSHTVSKGKNWASTVPAPYS